MADTQKKRARKLRKSQKNFFRTIGAKGGTATRDRQEPGYFSRIAKLSHQRRRERAAAEQPGE